MLGAADEAPFLGPAGRADQVGQAPAAMAVEEGEQERELGRLGPEDGLDGHVEDRAGGRRLEVGVEPARQGLGVEGRRVGRRPGSFEGDLPRGEVEVEDGLDPLGRRLMVRGRDQPGVGVPGPLAPLHRLAQGVGGEGLDPELGGQGRQMVLGRPDPLTPLLDGKAPRGPKRPGPPADPVAGLDDLDIDAGRSQVARAAASPANPAPTTTTLALAVLCDHRSPTTGPAPGRCEATLPRGGPAPGQHPLGTLSP